MATARRTRRGFRGNIGDQVCRMCRARCCSSAERVDRRVGNNVRRCARRARARRGAARALFTSNCSHNRRYQRIRLDAELVMQECAVHLIVTERRASVARIGQCANHPRCRRGGCRIDCNEPAPRRDRTLVLTAFARSRCDCRQLASRDRRQYGAPVLDPPLHLWCILEVNAVQEGSGIRRGSTVVVAVGNGALELPQVDQHGGRIEPKLGATDEELVFPQIAA